MDARLKQGLRVTLIGLGVNALLAIGKLIAGRSGHSHALVADALESCADIVTSFVVWRGLVIAAEPADEDHPYGHGKAEPIAAAIVSAMLMVAAGWIVLGAAREMSQPRPMPASYTLLILAVAIGVKEVLFRVVLRTSKAVESSAISADAWHHRSDVITSIAAAIGISIALLGGKGFENADNIAAIVAALVIAYNGWRLLRPAVNELMDRSPAAEFKAEIVSVARQVPGVDRVEKCIVRKMGYQYYVDMHVEVDPQMTVLRSHTIAHEVKNKVCRLLPSVRDVLVHIEPARQRA
jgi:cation diffusion facilitator family transporter